MNVIDKDHVEIDKHLVSRTQLENALRMLNNYTPPAPQFQAGDIVEPIGHSYGDGRQLVVIKGYTERSINREYPQQATKPGNISLTNGYCSWLNQDPRNFRKVGSL